MLVANDFQTAECRGNQKDWPKLKIANQHDEKSAREHGQEMIHRISMFEGLAG